MIDQDQPEPMKLTHMPEGISVYVSEEVEGEIEYTRKLGLVRRIIRDFGLGLDTIMSLVDPF